MAENTITKPERTYLPSDFKAKDWASLKPWFEELESREIQSVKALEQWMKDRSELEAVVSEDAAWRFINHTRDTTDKEAEERYLDFVRNIQPQLSPYEHALDQKFLNNPYVAELDQEKYHNYIRLTRNNVELYREANIPLFSELEEKAQQYGSIIGSMTVEVEGKELTLPQASVYIRKPDRKLRAEVFEKVNDRRLQEADRLQDLFSELVQKRHQVARNADFDNFRDFQFRNLGRFDYTVDDVLKFHTSIRDELVPLVDGIQAKRKSALKVDKLRPYDGAVDIEGKPPLKPARDSDELVEKTIECFSRLNPDFGHYLGIMKEKGYLDMDSRKGKAPGGYNYPLDEVGIPFIFMNAKGDFSDLVTLVHEGGHAVHSFLTRDYEIGTFRHTPSEVAELASMTMELLSMEHWDIFFDDEEDLKRAKREQLHDIIKKLPWIAIISKFQHWAYTHPEHSHEERNQAWEKIYDEFRSKVEDWSGYEHYKWHLWQKQLHVYEVPFYYIEYGMAQLGAVAIWKNYKENPDKALADYTNALKLGYTKPIPEIYETAGIRFDFSPAYLRELSTFIQEELGKLE